MPQAPMRSTNASNGAAFPLELPARKDLFRY
jgi:hypothetical protein